METAAKTCRECREEKSLDQYAWQNRNTKKLRLSCKECDASASELFGNANEYEARRAARMFLKYEVTPSDEDRILKRQNGSCAACGSTPEGRRLAVDYCQETATVRGLLCPPCLQTIKQVGADVNQIFRAVNYLTARNEHVSA